MNSRTHYFRDEEDNRTVVITRETAPGRYIAYLGEPPGNVFLRGKGETMMEAIVDLRDVLAKQEEV
jgi:hypothetical protein